MADFPAVPSDEAIAYLRDKLRLPTEAWTDLWEGMHARGFVVAGATRDALLADFHAALMKALETGTTIETFRADFDRIVAAHGWSYKGGRGWRSRVIFETNLRMAYQAGRWAQAQQVADRRPYLRYSAILDDSTRPQHRAWHGTILPIQDDWWRTHYPPNGWNCRCTVFSLSQDDLDREGWAVTPAPAVALQDHLIKTPDGPVTLPVPDGIDPGFGYNAGEAAWGRSQQLVLLESHGPFEPLTGYPDEQPRPPVPADQPRAPISKPIPRGDVEGLRQVLRDAIGGDAAIFTDPAGGRVRVTQAIVDHILEKPDSRWDGREAFFPLIPEVVQQPAEIWIGFARSSVSGRVQLRRRYVKVVQETKGRVVGLVADAEKGLWSGITFFRGRLSYLDSLRAGFRVFMRKV